MKFNSILESIGNTPVLNISALYPNALSKKIEIWIKLERLNPGGSIKDRIALAMIEDAEEKGLLTPDSTIIEPTSGNTGIGLALVSAVKGYKIILVMPESLSLERRHIMKAFGAQLELTAREKGMKGAIDRVLELDKIIPHAFIPMQFNNEANPAIHAKTTAQEIINDFPEGIDIIVGGSGTGGHLTGCARTLKKKFPLLKVYVVEPAESAVIAGGEPSSHFIQGIGPGFIPNNLDLSLIDQPLAVSHKNAFEYTRKICQKLGLFAGISTGASLAAIEDLLPSCPFETKILTFCYDTGERYLSVSGLFELD